MNFNEYAQEQLTRTNSTSYLGSSPLYGWYSWQGILEPAIFVSVYQQLTEHEHHGMAMGHEYVDKTKVHDKGYRMRENKFRNSMIA